MNVMPQKSEKTSTAISVYLSPRAAEVLKKYYENSGFGSISRTVEEMILSYDKIYTTLVSSLASSGVKTFFSNPAVVVMTFLVMINSLNLSDGSPFEKVLRKNIEQMIRERSGK